jgi:hypothetical protein
MHGLSSWANFNRKVEAAATRGQELSFGLLNETLSLITINDSKSSLFSFKLLRLN